jgi:nitrogen-specific signal transduction histidine kinase
VGVYDCGCVYVSVHVDVFGVFASVVERQQIVMQGVVKSAEKAAATERELNEFLAHEVRNPLSGNVGPELCYLSRQ